jgi:hypothetical protein
VFDFKSTNKNVFVALTAELVKRLDILLVADSITELPPWYRPEAAGSRAGAGYIYGHIRRDAVCHLINCTAVVFILQDEVSNVLDLEGRHLETQSWPCTRWWPPNTSVPFVNLYLIGAAQA